VRKVFSLHYILINVLTHFTFSLLQDTVWESRLLWFVLAAILEKRVVQIWWHEYYILLKRIGTILHTYGGLLSAA